MDRIGVVDTMFARYDMGAEAVDELEQCPGHGERFEIVRRTVPGFKDLGVAAKRLIQHDGCGIVIALAMPGRAAIDQVCAHEASQGIMLAQLLTNTHVQASASARQQLAAGQVDPRLLVTLSTLAALMPLRLIAFEDLSPGASTDVPLRGAEIGAAAPAGLSAMAAFMRAQQGEFAPAVARITQDASGQRVFIVRYDAPGPMGLEGS